MSNPQDGVHFIIGFRSGSPLIHSLEALGTSTVRGVIFNLGNFHRPNPGVEVDWQSNVSLVYMQDGGI